MAERSGFFDAHLIEGEWDRTYLAEDFARYFASFIGNGIFGKKLNELMVYQKDTADMSIKVSSGQAYINGYQYENDDELSLAIDVADGVLNRIDLIVLRWNNLERVIRLAVKKGTPATNASAPVLQRDADFYELKLAEIYISAGATKISQMNITDTRLDTIVCGLVTGVVEQLDTTDLGNQLQSFIDKYAADYKAYIENLQTEHTNEINEIVESFNSWINQLKIDKENEVNELVAMLNELVVDANNDLINLKFDVEQIKKAVNEGVLPAIESADFPGCFYTMVGDEVEWINTPGQYGVEYRTSERHQGKPVYEKTLYVAKLSNTEAVTVRTGIPGKNIIHLYGYMVEGGSVFHTFPSVKTNVVNTTAAIASVNGTGTMTIYVATNLTTHECFVKIKYIKP